MKEDANGSRIGDEATSRRASREGEEWACLSQCLEKSAEIPRKRRWYLPATGDDEPEGFRLIEHSALVMSITSAPPRHDGR